MSHLFTGQVSFLYRTTSQNSFNTFLRLKCTWALNNHWRVTETRDKAITQTSPPDFSSKILDYNEFVCNLLSTCRYFGAMLHRRCLHRREPGKSYQSLPTANKSEMPLGDGRNICHRAEDTCGAVVRLGSLLGHGTAIISARVQLFRWTPRFNTSSNLRYRVRCQSRWIEPPQGKSSHSSYMFTLCSDGV